jgi:hypothetical protein
MTSVQVKMGVAVKLQLDVRFLSESFSGHLEPRWTAAAVISKLIPSMRAQGSAKADVCPRSLLAVVLLAIALTWNKQ